MISARHQNQHAIEVAEVGANAAHSAADTAKQTLDFSRQEFRMEQRPYIEPFQAGFDDHAGNAYAHVSLQSYVGTNRQPELNVSLNNIGHSPAIHMEITRPELIIDETAVAVKRAKQWVPVYLPSEIILFPNPGAEITFRTVRLPIMDRFLFGSLVNKSKSVFFLGAARYTDMYLPRIPFYETVFCFELNPIGVAFTGCPPSFNQTRIK
jgi:hypothetical protein